MIEIAGLEKNEEFGVQGREVGHALKGLFCLV